MLLRNKSEFEYRAWEWAVRYAGAPRRDRGESSGGATAESIRRKAQRAQEREEKSKSSAYGLVSYWNMCGQSSSLIILLN